MRVKRSKDTCSQFRAEKRALSKAIGVGLRVGGAAMVLSMSSHALSQSSAVVELSELDGSDGFVINGVDAYDYSGISVSDAGDINGDSIADLIVGAFRADANGVYSAR